MDASLALHLEDVVARHRNTRYCNTPTRSLAVDEGWRGGVRVEVGGLRVRTSTSHQPLFHDVRCAAVSDLHPAGAKKRKALFLLVLPGRRMEGAKNVLLLHHLIIATDEGTKILLYLLLNSQIPRGQEFMYDANDLLPTTREMAI